MGVGNVYVCGMGVVVVSLGVVWVFEVEENCGRVYGVGFW